MAAGSPRPEPGGVTSLTALLSETTRLCPGVVEALVTDAEGVLVASHPADAVVRGSEELAVQAVAAAPALVSVATAASLEPVSEWMIIGSTGVLVGRRIEGTELLVILRAAPDCYTGRVRFAARIAAGRLSHLLAV